MALTLYEILKEDSTDGHLEPVNPTTDGSVSGGFYPQTSTTIDATVGVERDVSGNLVLKDGITGAKTLAQLAAGSGATNTTALTDFLLDNEPVKAGTTYTATYGSGKLTNETWTTTSTSKTAKTIDYTYSSNKVATEVRKLFATDGITITDQATITYSYTGSLLSTSSLSRDLDSSSSATLSVEDFFLDNDPDKSTTGYATTISSGNITKETWTTTATGFVRKTIDYTYSSRKVATEVRKVFATSDGTTVTGQVTITYSYSGSLLSSYVLTRDT